MNSPKAYTTKSPLHLTALAAVSIASIFLSSTSCCCNAFTSPIQHRSRTSSTYAPSTVVISMIPNVDNNNSNNNNENQAVTNNTRRRSILTSLLTSSATAALLFSNELPAFAENETMERGGVKLTPFNSLAFNYRGGESPTVETKTLNEESIPYSDFLDKLNSDQVKFVEFLAPNGDAAYATFKDGSEGAGGGSSNKPVRIGEGYPIEDPEGWSSPAFVIKAVAKKKVPYKFVVPGLSDSFKNM